MAHFLSCCIAERCVLKYISETFPGGGGNRTGSGASAKAEQKRCNSRTETTQLQTHSGSCDGSKRPVDDRSHTLPEHNQHRVLRKKCAHSVHANPALAPSTVSSDMIAQTISLGNVKAREASPTETFQPPELKQIIEAWPDLPEPIKKGIIAVLFSGLMSSAMSFGLQGGGQIEELAMSISPVTSVAWKGMPVLVVVLFGGFLVNFTWCVLLNLKNKTAGDYIKPEGPVLLANIVFAALAGAIWCSQFICYKTGEPQMGKTSYIGWAVLMASAIMFSQILALFLGEWKGTSKKTVRLLVTGLVLLVASAVVAGYSGHLGSQAV